MRDAVRGGIEIFSKEKPAVVFSLAAAIELLLLEGIWRGLFSLTILCIVIMIARWFGIGFFSKRFKTAGFVLLFLLVPYNHHFDFFDSYVYTDFVFYVSTIVMAYVFSRSDYRMETNPGRIFARFIVEGLFFAYPLIALEQSLGIAVAVFLGVLLYYWVDLLFFTIMHARKWLRKHKDLFIRDDEDCASDYEIKIAHAAAFLIIFGVGFCLSILFYPGIISWDNAEICYYADHLGDYSYRTDIHSFAWVLVVWLFRSITKNYYLITFALILAFSMVWSLWLGFFFKRGLRMWLVVAISVVWMMFPENQFMLIMSWKDAPFVICMLLAAYYFIKQFFDKDFSTLDALLLAISLFGMAVFRSNGQAALAVVCVYVLVLWLRKLATKKLIVSCMAAVAALLIFKGPIFSIMHVQQTPEGFAALPFVDGVWENVYAGNELSPEVDDFVIHQVASKEELIEAYRHSTMTIYSLESNWENIKLSDAMDAYLWCLRNYPRNTILSRLKRTYNIWSVFPSGKYGMNYNFAPEISNLPYDDAEYIWAYPWRFREARAVFAELYMNNYFMSYLLFFLGRTGLCIVLWIVSNEYMRKQGKSLSLIIMPAIGNTIGLMIACCYNDIRYYYPMFVLTVPYMISVFMSDIDNQKS